MDRGRYPGRVSGGHSATGALAHRSSAECTVCRPSNAPLAAKDVIAASSRL
jgi:hypothetical protein